MLIAALLFAVGMAEGWHYRAGALMVSSTLVLLAWLALWAFLWTASDVVKVLLLLANLAAHIRPATSSAPISGRSPAGIPERRHGHGGIPPPGRRRGAPVPSRRSAAPRTGRRRPASGR